MRVTPIGGGVILQNDRKLVISVGSSRSSKNWVQTEMMWSEFTSTGSASLITA